MRKRLKTKKKYLKLTVENTKTGPKDAWNHPFFIKINCVMGKFFTIKNIYLLITVDNTLSSHTDSWNGPFFL